MPLIATPGHAQADALITRDFFVTWATSMGFDLADKDPETQIDPAIRRASQFMALAFAWKGQKLNGRLQPMPWPRTNVYDEHGGLVSSETIPPEVEMATAYAAWQELQQPNSLMPVVPTNQPQVKRKRVGSLELEYFAPAQDVRPTITAIAPTVAELLVADRGSGLVGFSYRV